MEITSLLIGLALGIGVAYGLFYIFSKSRSVPRSTHDTLSAVYQETLARLMVADERLKDQLQQNQKYQDQAGATTAALSSHISRTATLEASLQLNSERLQEVVQQLNIQTEVNATQQKNLSELQQYSAELRAQNAALSEKLQTHKQEIMEMQKTAHLQFEKIAQQIFEEKSGKFTEANKQNIEALLKPLGENIDTFKKKVEETYDKESKQRFSLEEKVKDLIENTQKISQEANNLASALKGQAKKQGDWGETILERILEMSGLQRDREYFVQGNLKDEQGKNQRPDIIVRLPDDRNIIIDSKVSLNAYLRYTETDTREQQDVAIASHLHAISLHIDQLSGKKYDELTSSLDFVILFIPIEPAYILAVQSDPELWSYAYTRRILLISPTNLIAVLKIVADLWKRELQNKNAMEIASEGARLYDKFVGFAESLEDIGKHIYKSQESYIRAMGQLREGRGNLISRALKFKSLGLKNTKQLPASMTASQDDEDAHETSSADPEAEESSRS